MSMKKLSDLITQQTNLQDLTGQTLPATEDAQPMSLTITCFDPTDPEQACPVCGGLGVIKYAVPPEDKRFGKLFRCPNNPIEVDQQRHERMRRLSNLSAFTDKSLENFVMDVPGYSEKERLSLQMAFQATRQYAQNLDGWLLLEGAYGCGKTHLAAAVGNARLQRGDMVLFITTPDLLDHLRASFAPDAELSYDQSFERLRDVGLLIIDDLGVENPSEWAKEKLFQLLNHRYSYRKPTIITTNRDLDSLDPRIRSRLLDVNVIHHVSINAPDYRNAQPNTSDQLLSRLSLYEHMTFDNFDVDRNLTTDERTRLTAAARIAYEYARQPMNWLLFTGKFGSGKTHLAASIAIERRNAGDEVVMLTVPDLLDYLRATFAPDSNVTVDKLLMRLRDVPLLVLDDLGNEASKPWAQEKLFQLLDHRYITRMPTVITTTKQMNEINQRLVSRLIDQRICRMVEIDVPPYAMRMKRNHS
ncbi:MAG: ATP-binding protein [Anaerolineae bacterium]